MVSIVYLTFRNEPKFEWFLDSLWTQYQLILNQHPDLKIELIFIDGILWDKKTVVNNRKQKLKEAINGRFDRIIHQPPKPSAFQGPHKKTQDDFFIAAGCRNTGACYASHNYIVFVDDLSVLMPKWLERVIDAKNNGKYVVAGAYKKVNEMEVEHGIYAHGKIPEIHIDSRWSLGSDKKPVKIQGGQLYGCSFGMPIEWYLEVNGQNELCDSVGGEDYELGLRLEKHGYKIMYDRQMLTYESNDLHQDKSDIRKHLYRGDPRVTQEEYIEIRKKYGLAGPPIYSTYDMSHMILEMSKLGVDLWESQSPLIGDYAINLRQLRHDALQGSAFSTNHLPSRHFFTGQKLSEFKTFDMINRQIEEIIPTIEGWCTVDKAQKMAQLVFLNQLRNCVELGVFAGRSMIPIALALRHCCYPRGRLFAIDPWTKSAALEGSNSEVNDDWWSKLDYDHFHKYTWNKVFEHDLSSVVQLMRLKSSEVVDWFADSSLDLLHQDANHSEETSTEEVHRWAPKVRSGGFWIFDDTNWTTTRKAQNLLVSDYNFEEIEDYKSWKIYRKN